MPVRFSSRHPLRRLIREILDGYGNKNLGRDGVAGNLRYDVPTTGHKGSNVLFDEEADDQKEKQSAKQAACCLITKSDGRVLAVSRRDDPTMWGLPGGKVDAGETPEQAAARELQEETGLIAHDLNLVITQTDSQGYETSTFACKVDGEIGTDEEGLIRWVEPAVLLDPSSSPFVDYNQALFKKLGTI